MLAAVAVKQLERVTSVPPAKPELVVFEQYRDDEGMFSGIRKVSVKVSDA
jgi:hypothetical protein